MQIILKKTSISYKFNIYFSILYYVYFFIPLLEHHFILYSVPESALKKQKRDEEQAKKVAEAKKAALIVLSLIVIFYQNRNIEKKDKVFLTEQVNMNTNTESYITIFIIINRLVKQSSVTRDQLKPMEISTSQLQIKLWLQ